jgi:flavin reductase (DIM6/NTAB) family NADH-FMN oxidoreductase RutF
VIVSGTAAPRDGFDAFVGGLDYPMYIVTASEGDRQAGCLVGFAGQCSISPARFMVWLSKRNHTYEVSRHAETVAVHAPPRPATRLAELFGTRTGFEVDKFAQCSWRRGPGGVALLDDCPAWFAGAVLSRHDTGDHVGLLLRPVAVGAGLEPGRQLGFQDVRHLPPGNEA